MIVSCYNSNVINNLHFEGQSASLPVLYCFLCGRCAASVISGLVAAAACYNRMFELNS